MLLSGCKRLNRKRRRSATHTYLIDLHSLLRGPGLRVGSSEDPELGFDQGAVGQVDPTDVKMDDSVVGAGCYWLHRV